MPPSTGVERGAGMGVGGGRSASTTAALSRAPDAVFYRR